MSDRESREESPEEIMSTKEEKEEFYRKVLNLKRRAVPRTATAEVEYSDE